MFSKKISSLEQGGADLEALLRQINYLQDELERRFAQLEARVRALEDA